MQDMVHASAPSEPDPPRSVDWEAVRARSAADRRGPRLSAAECFAAAEFIVDQRATDPAYMSLPREEQIRAIADWLMPFPPDRPTLQRHKPTEPTRVGRPSRDELAELRRQIRPRPGEPGRLCQIECWRQHADDDLLDSA